MGKIGKRIIAVCIFLTAVLAGLMCVRQRTFPIEQLLDISTTEDGSCVAAWYEEDNTVIAKIGEGGRITRRVAWESEQGDEMYTVRGIAAGAQDRVYVLRDRRDSYNGNLLEQELVILDFAGLRGKVEKIFSLSAEGENYCYGWIKASGDSVSLIAADAYESSAIRRTYEFGSVLSGTLTIKNTRTYPLKEGEGIYKAIGNSTDMVYISDSGKVFKASEEEVIEIFPARDLDTLMYAGFIAYAESGYIYLGESESGNILKVDLSTGDEEVLLKGSSTFNGSSLHTPKDIVTISMTNLNNFAAVVKNEQSDSFHILLTEDGVTETITSFRYTIGTLLVKFLQQWIFYLAAAMLFLLLVFVFITGIREGRTIMGRLIYATIPLVVVAMFLFGLIAFNYYRNAIHENFVKQTVDEGNMLSAVFGQESFNEIEYPYDYTSEAYQYLIRQMETRDLYIRIVYYENSDLYIGVDANTPCFYSFDILMNTQAEKLYEKAALTGQEVTGTIHDAYGERLVCITPIGGLSGQTVYLMETGLYTANIRQYEQSYIGDFAIICGAFMIILLVVLGILFYRILSPVGEMKQRMQQFAEGDHSIRLVTASEDEITGIARVFNKMADDMDVQIHNLEKMGATYYRFIPISIISLLGQDNLAELTTQSQIEGDYAILHVSLKLPPDVSLEEMERMTGSFFNTVHYFARQNDAVPIADHADLRSMHLICKQGVDSAVVTALTILARTDADNATCAPREKLKISFVLHYGRLHFGICGNEERYISVLLSPEFDRILARKDFLEQFGSRLLLTEEAYERMSQSDVYANRYVGRLRMEETSTGIYDIYDDRSAEQIRTWKSTQHAFEKAMELFEKKFYYEAKNLYAMVLRENPEDMAARYYIFCCEDLEKKALAESDR